MHGGRGERHETRYLSVTVTTGWIDPAKVDAASAVGGLVWNGFQSHRPDTPRLLTKALLEGDLRATLQMWNFDGEPLNVTRVPGPAGPLYERDANGTHRIHTARMIGLPLLWGEIRQYTLPLRIHVRELFSMRGHAPNRTGARRVIDCWRGLLDRGLVVGDLHEQTDLPGMAAPEPDWAAAPWLLAEPADAIRWAAIYQRAYPGALAALGIPSDAWQNTQSWHAWLTATEAHPAN